MWWYVYDFVNPNIQASSEVCDYFELPFWEQFNRFLWNVCMCEYLTEKKKMQNYISKIKFARSKL